ncbi:MAG: cation transporter [Candidatus Izimaplasma sp.]|nr:cation transporter [Candidatus Izimaplasma bacterium]
MKFNVKDMTCNHCKKTIEKVLRSNGFKDVKVDLDAHTVEFELNGRDKSAAKRVIETKGYTVE